MSLYFKFYGLETTKTPSGVFGAAVSLVKVLRRFTDARRRSSVREKLNGIWDSCCRFQDKNRIRLHLSLLRNSIRTEYRHHSTTVAGDYGTVRHLQKGKYASFLSKPTSNPLLPSIARIAEKFEGKVCLPAAVLSDYTAKTNALRMHSTMRVETILTSFPSQSSATSLFRGRLSVLTSAFHRIERFKTNLQPHLKPSTALCAVSQ